MNSYFKFDLSSQRDYLWAQIIKHLHKKEGAKARQRIKEMLDISRFWAFPGAEVIEKVDSYTCDRKYSLAASLSQNVLSKISSPRSREFLPYESNLELLDTLKYDYGKSKKTQKKRHRFSRPIR